MRGLTEKETLVDYSQYRCKNWKDRVVLTAIVLFALSFVWWLAFGASADSGGCRPGWEVTAADCGHDDY